MKHATIIPLIGGVSLASDAVYGVKPEWIASYDVFKNNDSHLINHYEFKNHDIPYKVLDKPEHSNISLSKDIDVVSTVCPCAGLSTLGHTGSADNPLNEWMATTAEFVLGEVKPQVFWGENAPSFASARGEKIRNRIYDIGKKNGYTMTVYKTKSLLHGLPQYRQRSFYFFWKEKDAVPMLEYYLRPRPSIKDFILDVEGNSQRELTNNRQLMDNLFYRYIREEMHPDLTHAEYIEQLTKSWDVTNYIVDKNGISFGELSKYFKNKGHDNESAKCERRQTKLDSGGGIMTKTLCVPKNYTGAFVGHLPTNMCHPVEERYLSYRECMAMMGLPSDFELLNPKKNLNHVCQNVPFTTAKDMATEVYAYLNGNRPMVNANKMLQDNHKKQHKIWDENINTIEGFL